MELKYCNQCSQRVLSSDGRQIFRQSAGNINTFRQKQIVYMSSVNHCSLVVRDGCINLLMSVQYQQVAEASSSFDHAEVK